MLPEVGFEPTKLNAEDLKSTPFDHSGIQAMPLYLEENLENSMLLLAYHTLVRVSLAAVHIAMHIMIYGETLSCFCQLLIVCAYLILCGFHLELLHLLYEH